MPHKNNITFKIKNETFAALTFGDPTNKPLLALHGWLDNAATFSRLGPLLQNRYVVALDLPGHGESDHSPGHGNYAFADTALWVARAADTLGFDQFDLMGHSLGANVAVLTAAGLSDCIKQLVLIEGIGPPTESADKAAQRFGNAIKETLRRTNKQAPVYASEAHAIAARQHVSEMTPAAVEIIVKRNLRAVEGGVTWRTDPRLKSTSATYFTEDHVHNYLSTIECSVLLIMADKGFLAAPRRGADRAERLPARMKKIARLSSVTLPGQHHLHLDDAKPVAAAINEFLM